MLRGETGGESRRCDACSIAVDIAEFLARREAGETKFAGIELTNGALRCADLRHVQLAGAKLSRLDLRGADLTRANLQGATLRDVVLRGAHLFALHAPRVVMMNVELSAANLHGADLEGAELAGVRLDMAQLSHATLRRANLRGANLKGANLSRADARQAIVAGADLTDVIFEQTLLDGTGIVAPNTGMRAWSRNEVPPGM